MNAFQAVQDLTRSLALPRDIDSREADWGPAASPHAGGFPLPLADAAMLALAASVAALLVPGIDGRLGVAVAALSLALLAARGAYGPTLERPLGEQLSLGAGVTAVAVLCVAGLSSIVGKDVTVGPYAWLWAASTATLAAGRVVAAVSQRRARLLGRGTRATLIVGAGRIGHLTARRLRQRPELGLRPVGFLDKEPRSDLGDSGSLPVLGASWDLETVIADRGIGQVIIAFSTAPDEVLLSIVRRSHEAGVPVAVVPRLFEVDCGRSGTTQLGALPLLHIPAPRNNSWQLHVKYALDRLFAAVAILVLLPLLALVAAAIWATGGRPIFYRQQRAGHFGRPFWMYKFRTMTGDAVRDGEADAGWAAAALGEPRPPNLRITESRRRATVLGALLRPYSLDELPQLWNVLRGDMSLIGPRPERLSYVERFSPAIYRYAERHRIKPGLTGWAQVNGLRGETSLTDRVEWDNFYVENWSWKLDARIMVRTVLALRAPTPASREQAAQSARERPGGVKRAAYKLAATLVLLALMLLAVATSHADAAGLGGTGASAVDQYVESLPTASGPVALAPSSGGGGSDNGAGGGTSGHSGHGAAARGLPLSQGARTSLRQLGPSVAHELTLTATAPQLGAPTRRLSPAPANQSTPSGVNAAAKALADDGGGQLVWLLIVLGAITILAAGAALNDRTRGQRAD
jgi:exopolysaccharide biosynthesis polyprenyl glycosylphosphotransferase